MLTPQQLEERRKYVCASDVAAILGRDEWKTPSHIYRDKTTTYVSEPGKAARAGNYLERAVMDWMDDELTERLEKPVRLTRHVMRVAANGFMAANFDGIHDDLLLIAEGKTTGVTGPADEGYGRAGTQQLPERVILQCHAQMIVAGMDYRRVYVGVLRGWGKGFGLYYVDREQKLCDYIEEKCHYFWHEHVLKGIAPITAEAA
jgi:predicted phage-related endonuclease